MKKRGLMWIAVILLIGALGVNVLAAAMPEFSADMKMSDSKDKIMTGKVFMEGQKIRQELATGKGNVITILRLDKKVSWMLMVDNKQYIETKLTFDPAHPGDASDIKYEKTQIGNEKVNGFDCTIYQYTYAEKKYGIMKQWLADKLGFPIKIQTSETSGKVTSTMEYSNIKQGKQPDSLFEIPEGYKKFDMGGFKLPGM
jgi:outer membrane lipoprotein-sorting protein